MTETQKAPSSTLWTAAEADKVTGGQSTHDWFATGVSIDSRTLHKGDLFIALNGDNADGHAYVAKAFENGAAAAVVSHKPDGLPDNAPLLIVGDTFKALQDLGQGARQRTSAHVIAVTGSVGKTGTKEMLAAAFSRHGQTHAAQKSYNNHWGVPLTLSAMHAGTDFGIFEVGMNHPGEITPLSKQVQPDIAIITTVAPVHIEHFENGLDGIADAKAEKAHRKALAIAKAKKQAEEEKQRKAEATRIAAENKQKEQKKRRNKGKSICYAALVDRGGGALLIT